MKHIYLVPGLAASPGIFEYLKLPVSLYTLHHLPWDLPLQNESLIAYCKRFKKHIVHDNPILLGVSFGGIVAQELACLMPVDKIIIVSSIKSTAEFPKGIRFAKALQVHKILPTFLVAHIDLLFEYNFGIGQKKLERYSRYLQIRDKHYLDWSFDCIVNWDRTEADPRVIHLHGECDEIFPIKHLTNFTLVPAASHAAIITHARWFNEQLPKILSHTL